MFYHAKSKVQPFPFALVFSAIRDTNRVIELPSYYYSPYEELKQNKQRKGTTATRNSFVDLPKESIVETPLNSDFRHPTRRMDTTYNDENSYITTRSDVTYENEVIIKSVKDNDYSYVVRQIQSYGQMKQLNQSDNNDIIITFYNKEDAKRLIRKGILKINGHKYFIKGYNKFHEEFGCGEFVEYLDNDQTSFWDYIMECFCFK